MSDQPKYLDASPAELLAWKSDPMTVAYFEWVQWEIERGREVVCDLLHDGEVDKARVSVGVITGLRAALQSTDRPTPVQEFVPDDDFEDPAEGKRK